VRLPFNTNISEVIGQSITPEKIKLPDGETPVKPQYHNDE